MFAASIRRWLDALPSQCLVCRAWPSQSLCESCVTRFAQPLHRCQSCAITLPADVLQCGQCVKKAPPIDRCLAAVSYEYPWSGLITDYKFHEQTGLAVALALLLRSAPWVEPALDSADLVLPIPLSEARLMQRGFNQAQLLAQRLAPGKCESNLLLRLTDRPAQSSLSRSQRITGLEHAFAVDPLRYRRISDARVVLIDDVMTSGATLGAAARALRLAGAAHITAIVIARTQ